MHTILYYPKSWYNYTATALKQIINGCGPGGWKIDLVPDSIFGCDISMACNIHDFMYHMGSTIEDKDRADRVFLNNMSRLVMRDSYNWYSKWLMYLRLHYVKRYYQAVSIFGGSAFWDSKEDDTDD